jgi:apolipoprotein D and lipocalin family protein
VAILVPSTFAQVPGFGACPTTSVVQNFDVNRYLGKWYEIKSFFAIFQIAARCVEAEYGLNPNGTVSVLNKAIRFSRPIEILGNAELPDPNVGKLIVKFRFSPCKIHLFFR